MAHQWFGDLVTMAWWDDLWLNEGFATWMAARTETRLHPEWNTALNAVGERKGAMSRDELATTHPVVQHVATVEQASQAFDAITYSKGAAVNADAATWDALHAAALAERTPLIRTELFDLLAVVADPALAQRALDLALTDEPETTAAAGMIYGVAGQHPDRAFDFTVAHWPAVSARLDSGSRSSFAPQIGSGSADPAMIAKIQAFAAKYVAAGARRPADTAVASIAYRIKVRRERLPAIDAWLARHPAAG